MRKMIKLGTMLTVAVVAAAVAFPVQALITNADIASNAGISYSKLKLTKKITSKDIKDGTIKGKDIDDEAIETDNIEDDAVTSEKIEDGTIVAADLAAGTLTATVLADGAVTSAKILDGTILTGDISADTILAADIAAGAVATSEILDGTILVGDLADGAVTSAKILDSTIASADIAADTIAAADIAAGAVASSELLDESVASADILDGTIAAGDLAANIAITTTGTTTLNGITVIGDGGDNASINSTSWGITTGGVVSGLTGITGTMITDASIGGGDFAPAIAITTNNTITTTAGGTITSSGLLTASGGLTVVGDMKATPQSAAGTAAEGVIYYDSDDDNLYVYANGAFVDLTAGASGAPSLDDSYNASVGASTVIVDSGALTLRSNAASTNGDINVDLNSTGDFQIQNAGVTYATFDADGNVALTGTLDVQGNVSDSAGIFTVGDDLNVTGATTLDGAVTLGNAAADIVTVTGTIAGASPLVFEGAVADAFETTFAITDGAVTTITFPATTGVVITNGDTATVTSAMIGVNVIAADDIADGAVTTGEILDLTIANGDLANDTINFDKVVDAPTLDANLAFAGAFNVQVAAGQGFDTSGAGALNLGATNATSAVIGSAALASLTVTTTGTGTTTVVLPDGAISTAEILDDTILAGDIATDAVTTTEILNATIATADIANDAITSALIAPNVVDQTDIATSGVATAEILNGTILGEDLGSGIAISTTSLANFNGGIAVDTNAFTVADTSGDILTAGDLDVNGNDIDTTGTLDITGATGMNINTGAGAVVLNPAGSGEVNPGADSTDSLGNDTTRWATIFADTLNYSAALTDDNSGNTTVVLGDSATLDNVDIIADTSVMDGEWSITAAGVANFASVGATAATAGTFTTLIGDTVQADTTVSFSTNGDSVNNAADDTFDFTREDAGTVTITASDNDANADLLVVAGGTGDLSLGDADSDTTVVGVFAANGATTLGDNGDNVTINSDVWDITAAGAASGLTGVVSSGTVSFTDDINIGNGAGDDVAVDSNTWDVTAAGVASGLTGITSTGAVNFSGATSLRIPVGAGLAATECDEAAETGRIYYPTSTAGAMTSGVAYICVDDANANDTNDDWAWEALN